MTDQLNRDIVIDTSKPLRIISLVPSQTELLYDLGLDNEVVGITKFCIHPKEWFKTKTRVGGTKNLNLDKIRELEPTLIIANKEENEKEQIELLSLEFPVWISDISTLEEALDMIGRIGALVGKAEKANGLIGQISNLHQQLICSPSHKRVLYLIWQNPIMAAGTSTFIHEMIHACGFVNALSDSRYPILNVDDAIALNPDLVFLSSEPFPFKEVHINEWQALLPHAKVKLVDGELFSWYGSRLLKSFDYFRALNEELA